METIKSFLSEFWSPFIGASFGLGIVWLLVRYASDSRLLFLTASAFPELSMHGKNEQRRLLHEASALASRRRRSFVPIIMLAICFGTGAAVARTLSNARAIPDSLWARSGVCGVFGALGGWLAIRTTTRFVRPFLRSCLDKTIHVA